MLKVVIFDLDGTLTKFNLDIKKIKQEILGEDSNVGLLDGIKRLDGTKRRKAEKMLVSYECEAAAKAELNTGVKELLGLLSRKGIKTAVVTRNNRKAAETIFKKHGLSFDAVVSREDTDPKPSSKQLELVLRRLGMKREEAVFIGDHRYDMEAGRAAGIKTGLIKNEFSKEILTEADFTINQMSELNSILFSGD